ATDTVREGMVQQRLMEVSWAWPEPVIFQVAIPPGRHPISVVWAMTEAAIARRHDPVLDEPAVPGARLAGEADEKKLVTGIFEAAVARGQKRLPVFVESAEPDQVKR